MDQGLNPLCDCPARDRLIMSCHDDPFWYIVTIYSPRTPCPVLESELTLVCIGRSVLTGHFTGKIIDPISIHIDSSGSVPRNGVVEDQCIVY